VPAPAPLRGGKIRRIRAQGALQLTFDDGLFLLARKTKQTKASDRSDAFSLL